MILSYCNPKYDKYYVYSHSAVVEPTATRTTNNFVGAHRSEQFDISSVFDCRFCCGSAVSRWRIQRIIVSRKNKAFVSKKIFFLKLEGYCVIWCTWDENPSIRISPNKLKSAISHQRCLFHMFLTPVTCSPPQN